MCQLAGRLFSFNGLCEKIILLRSIGALISDGLVDVVGAGHVIHPVARFVWHNLNTRLLAMMLEEQAEVQVATEGCHPTKLGRESRQGDFFQPQTSLSNRPFCSGIGRKSS